MGNCCGPAQGGKGVKPPTGGIAGNYSQLESKKPITSLEGVEIDKSKFVVTRDLSEIQKVYKIGDVIGTGAFGKVKKASRKDNGEVRAIKFIDKLNMSDEELSRLQHEVKILSQLNHQNIVHLHEVYESHSKIALVTELCDGVELFTEVISREKFTENESAQVMRQLFQAINYCHQNNIAHRDLKPENILIDTKQKGHIKVIDFGTALRQEGSENMTEMYGTPYYIAPEVLKGEYNNKCDIWSIGVILYILLCGNPPFNGRRDEEIISKVRKGHWEFHGSVWNEVSNEAKDLIKKLIIKNPADRLTAQEALDHPWIQQLAKTHFNKQVATGAISTLANFRNTSKLKQATMTFMTSHLATKKQIKQLRHSFQQFDTNGDGMIQREEFLKAYRSLYPNQDPLAVDEFANELFDKADADNSGGISYQEWANASIKQEEVLNEPNIKAAFQLFDKDNSGTIDYKEIGQLLGSGAEEEAPIWQKLINEVDVNGDGEIDFEEFKNMLKVLAEEKENQPKKGRVAANNAGIDQNARV